MHPPNVARNASPKKLSWLGVLFCLSWLWCYGCHLLIIPGHPVASVIAADVRASSVKPCRLIQHSMGTTCIPQSPQRIVILERLDNALILGVKPLGASKELIYGFENLLPDQTQGILSIGTAYPPNPERILQLKPDLIIGTWQTDIYPLLSKIAPTVLFSSDDPRFHHWQDAFRAYANVLNKTSEAERILTEYQQRIDQFRRQMGERLKTTTISLIWFAEMADFRIYLRQSFGGQVLEDVGLLRPVSQRQNEYMQAGLSLEVMQRLDGDYIFLSSRFAHPRESLSRQEQLQFARFLSHPLWSKLGAVQQRRVFNVDDRVWIGANTPVGANLILDDLFRYLTEPG
jgi:iron complex transport system substrate-binding protein